MRLILGCAVVFTLLASLVISSQLSRMSVQPGGGHALAAAAATNADWPHFGNTSDNTRFSPLTQINTGNVSKLGVAWTMAEGPQLAGFENDPVVINGVLYMTTNLDQVRAVNAATGQMLWQYTPRV